MKKDTKKDKWRRWSKRSTDEIGRPLPASDTFSGLMDIRRLVGAGPDEVYDTGSGVITLSGRLPASPPVVPPIQLNHVRQESTDWKIGLFAVILAGAVVISLALAVLLRDSERTVPAVAPEPSPEPAAAIVATNTDDIVPSSVASPERSDGERRRTDDADLGKNVDVGPPSLPAGASEGGTTTSTNKVKKSKKKSANKGKKKSKKKKSKSADSVLAFAEPATDGSRPKTLSRAQVKAGMSRVAGKVKRCGKGTSGLLLMDVVIGKNGRVVRATPTGSMAGTTAGKCASRAVRKAKFPQFSGPRVGVKYPFRL